MAKEKTETAKAPGKTLALVPLKDSKVKDGQAINFQGEKGGEAKVTIGQPFNPADLPADVVDWIGRLARKPAARRGWELVEG